nr:RNA-directed DNA polymerase, eukaryota, reverse transcriptase zinc-binding domain protein [Tanacetum cinerariifolium]
MMADQTMEELLQAPSEGYGEAIVIPEILAENFEIKTNFLQLVQANKFHGRENNNPHTHISNFKRLTATLKYRDVLNDDIKLMVFPYSLEDRDRIWTNIARVNTNSRDVVSKTEDRINKLADQISNLVDIVNKQVVAPAKAVVKVCVTCGGAHAYYECIATDSNPFSICATTGSYNQVSWPNRASHQIPPPGFALVQNNPNRFNQNQGQGNYFNQGNNFKGNNFQNNQAIVDEVRALHKKVVYVFDFMNLKLGNGEMVKFWLDRWFEGGILKDLFPRMFALENMKEVTVSSKLNGDNLADSFRRSPRGN